MKTIFRFSVIRVFFITLLITVADMIAVAYFHHRHNQEQEKINLRAIKIEQLSQQILHLDQMLTQSIRMYALKGEQIWKEYYEADYAKIATIFLQIRMISRRDNLAAYNQLFSINEEIGQLEKSIIKLVQKEQFLDAQQILEGKAYAQAKQKYTQHAEAFIKDLHIEQEQIIEQHAKKENWLTISLLLPIPFLLIVWFYVFKFIQKHLESEEELQENARQKELAYQMSSTENENIRKQTEQLDNVLKTNNKKLHETSQQLRQAYVKLADSEKMASIGIMTASLSHEIKNPVQFIYGGVGNLKTNLNDIIELFKKYQELDKDNFEKLFPQIKEYIQKKDIIGLLDELPEIVEDISIGAERITEVIRGLNDYARQDQKLSMFDVHKGLDTTLVILKTKINEKTIRVNKSYSKDFPQIECFSGKINQIFMNLIANAVQAMDKDGSLYIATHRQDSDFVQISIKDTGKGMNKETQNRIFEPFFTTKSSGEGTGLGLSIVQQIIEQHKGTIDLYSEEGVGTEFVITLPILQKL